MTVAAIVLAAGAGTRMRSSRPKPLHPICGRPMVLHVVHALGLLKPERTIVVVGHGAEQVSATISDRAPGWANIGYATQAQQNGTGGAAMVGLDGIGGDDYDDESTIVIVPGDTPLLRPESLDELVADHVANERAATLLTSRLDDPTGYGRVIRDRDGNVARIVEQRDAAPDELAVDEICTSIYAFRRDLLGPALRNLSTDNAQGELYLTDVIGSLVALGHRVGAYEAPATETQGVNDRWQLALAERELRNRINRRWLLDGVTMFDPRQTFIDVDVQLGRDVTLYPDTMLQGSTTVGNGSRIGPQVQLDNCDVGDDAVVRQSVGTDAVIGDRATVGPFAHLAPGAKVPPGAVVAAPPTEPTN